MEDIVAVVGTGIMGSGIAQIAAQAGIKVLWSDVSLDFAAKSKAAIAKQHDNVAKSMSPTAKKWWSCWRRSPI
nr:3-hydroxyacyl-CoA dehydrogenase NAD-binding domain-containing protein [Sphingomonas sp. CDS-1]